jgi:hypothetical protein
LVLLSGVGLTSGLREHFLVRTVLIALLISVAWTVAAAAQTKGNSPPAQSGTVCPPGAQTPPTVGGPSSPNLSEKLADSKGVICPPAGVDPEIHVPPPGGGELKVIPAPGAPGGNPDVQPK